ncbi:MAG: hypothetical protein ABSG80_08925 [Verrucomicrobiota bacterium]
MTHQSHRNPARHTRVGEVRAERLPQRMEIGKMPRPITIGNPRFLQVPSKPFDSRKTAKDRFVRFFVSFDFLDGFHHVRVQAHRRRLAVFRSGSPNLDKWHYGIQIQITPLQRRQF